MYKSIRGSDDMLHTRIHGWFPVTNRPTGRSTRVKYAEYGCHCELTVENLRNRRENRVSFHADSGGFQR